MKNYGSSLLFMTCLTLPVAAFADGQGVPINSDNLSFFEEPLATTIGPATLSANVLADQSVRYNIPAEEDTYNTRVNGDFRIETQLPNSWQIGVQYSARYDRLKDNDQQDAYTDDVAAFISDEWGTLAGGNVTGSVFEKTRRKRGFGNADLEGDNFVGELDETGGFYSVRYNSYEVSLAADKEGRAEAGLSFERPIGKGNYFTALRLRKGDTNENANTSDDGKSYGAAAVGQYIYASFLIDTQIGYENVDLENSAGKNDHVFGSIGTQYKYGAYRFSAEGVVGRYDGVDRRNAALGSRVDIARGASLNLGFNYTHEDDAEDMTSITSVRYEF